MNLPIDIGAVLKEFSNIDEAQKKPISLSLYMGMEAPLELVAHVRSCFLTNATHLRLRMAYIDDTFDASLTANDDMAVVVADETDLAGLAAAAIRCAGTPSLVIAPSNFTAQGDAAVPSGDLLVVSQYSEEEFAQLDKNIGAWIIEICKEKRLAFSSAFPFVARPLAEEAVSMTAAQNAGVGVVVFLPGADFPIMTLNQIKMLLQIAAAYGQPMTQERLVELIAVVSGGFVCRSYARNLSAFVPVLGWLVKGAIGYAGTWAMGKAAIEYFENGAGVSGAVSAAGTVAQKASGVLSRVKKTQVYDMAAQMVKKAIFKQELPLNFGSKK